MAAIRVLIADDSRIVRQGLRHVCESMGGFTVVGEAEDGCAAARLAGQLEALRRSWAALDGRA